MEVALPSKEELLNQLKVELEAYNSSVIKKLEKKAEEIKAKAKREIDSTLSKIKLEQ